MNVETDDTSVTIFATFEPRPGIEEAVMAALQEALIPTRAEPGCIRFDLYRSESAPTTLHLFEIFAAPDALAAHRQTEHYQAFRRKIDPLLARPPVVVRLKAVDAMGAVRSTDRCGQSPTELCPGQENRAFEVLKRKFYCSGGR
ncbi:putative quinol monooxygenase [Trinickia diaoshuihuensis]|uniref:putative quinol monooxygenase n=1 Tax=Trinickia diaoshuihuensis TaxID=2292265 RepID=UPI000E2405E2|nr:putative quinol monooxygenase [Trinickia diaoshuihuensis]